ncbi:MAG TPA: hypothetical protein PLL09_01220 [Flavobacterium sp.]|uniref:hypothetical protein n=1 Tax=unclassified Flavobacterium TaxID=196869 RepID=UPI0025BBB19E|nr:MULTISPECIES: hypothetical protein [unclassified Flavobacterium]HRE76421.1 hypothetical protein [Flavobacterium sp.]
MIKNSICFIALAFLTFSCSTSFDSEQEMMDYIAEEENGYRYFKNVNGVDYILQYRPTDLLVKQEMGEKVNKELVDSLRDKYGKYLYFNLSMSLNNQELLTNVANDKAKFGQMVNDLAFGMEEKVHLITPVKDTIAMTDFIYPRMYGMSNSTTIMLVYPNDKKMFDQDYLNFTIQDLGFYTGEVTIKINPKKIKNQPTLNF